MYAGTGFGGLIPGYPNFGMGVLCCMPTWFWHSTLCAVSQMSSSPCNLQEKWLPDINERSIPHSGGIGVLDMLTDDSTKVCSQGQ